MENKISFNGEYYTILKSIFIEKTEIAICINDANTKIVHLKANYIGNRASYVTLNALIKVLPDYQNIASENKLKILDAFIESLNKIVKELKNVNYKNIIDIIDGFEDYVFKNEIYYYTTKNIDVEIPEEKLKKLQKFVEKYGKEKKSLSDENNAFKKFWKKFKIFMDKVLYNKYCGAYSVMVIVSAVGAMICINQYNTWKESGKQTRKMMKNIFDQTEIVFDDKENEHINEMLDGQVDPSQLPVSEQEQYYQFGEDYWKYRRQSFMSVDFSNLMMINPDTVGWIFVNNTGINYPVVQAENNDYYLHQSFDGSNNIAGWIFADYRSDMVNFGKNTVIYGHGRGADQVMFGPLEKTLQPEWYQNENNQYIRLSTPTKNTVWKIVSIYTIQSEGYYLTHDFATDEYYRSYLNTIIGRSIYNFNTPVDITDKILTLSTCLDLNGNRIVVHAKLVRFEDR